MAVVVPSKQKNEMNSAFAVRERFEQVLAHSGTQHSESDADHAREVIMAIYVRFQDALKRQTEVMLVSLERTARDDGISFDAEMDVLRKFPSYLSGFRLSDSLAHTIDIYNRDIEWTPEELANGTFDAKHIGAQMYSLRMFDNILRFFEDLRTAIRHSERFATQSGQDDIEDIELLMEKVKIWRLVFSEVNERVNAETKERLYRSKLQNIILSLQAQQLQQENENDILQLYFPQNAGDLVSEHRFSVWEGMRDTVWNHYTAQTTQLVHDFFARGANSLDALTIDALSFVYGHAWTSKALESKFGVFEIEGTPSVDETLTEVTRNARVVFLHYLSGRVAIQIRAFGIHARHGARLGISDDTNVVRIFLDVLFKAVASSVASHMNAPFLHDTGAAEDERGARLEHFLRKWARLIERVCVLHEIDTKEVYGDDKSGVYNDLILQYVRAAHFYKQYVTQQPTRKKGAPKLSNGLFEIAIPSFLSTLTTPLLQSVAINGILSFAGIETSTFTAAVGVATVFVAPYIVATFKDIIGLDKMSPQFFVTLGAGAIIMAGAHTPLFNGAPDIIEQIPFATLDSYIDSIGSSVSTGFVISRLFLSLVDFSTETILTIMRRDRTSRIKGRLVPALSVLMLNAARFAIIWNTSVSIPFVPDGLLNELGEVVEHVKTLSNLDFEDSALVGLIDHGLASIIPKKDDGKIISMFWARKYIHVFAVAELVDHVTTSFFVAINQGSTGFATVVGALLGARNVRLIKQITVDVSTWNNGLGISTPIISGGGTNENPIGKDLIAAISTERGDIGRFKATVETQIPKFLAQLSGKNLKIIEKGSPLAQLVSKSAHDAMVSVREKQRQLAIFEEPKRSVLFVMGSLSIGRFVPSVVSLVIPEGVFEQLDETGIVDDVLALVADGNGQIGLSRMRQFQNIVAWIIGISGGALLTSVFQEFHPLLSLAIELVVLGGSQFLVAARSRRGIITEIDMIEENLKFFEPSLISGEHKLVTDKDTKSIRRFIALGQQVLNRTRILVPTLNKFIALSQENTLDNRVVSVDVVNAQIGTQEELFKKFNASKDKVDKLIEELDSSLNEDVKSKMTNISKVANRIMTIIKNDQARLEEQVKSIAIEDFIQREEDKAIALRDEADRLAEVSRRQTTNAAAKEEADAAKEAADVARRTAVAARKMPGDGGVVFRSRNG